jgi:hypothetical protein
MLTEFTTEEVKIGISVKGMLADEIEDMLIDAMNQNSLIVSSDPEGHISDFLFDCKMKIRESSGRTGHYFTTLKWTFSIRLRDRATGSVIYGDYISSENTSTDYEMALDRVIYMFEKKWVHEVMSKINRFFYES